MELALLAHSRDGGCIFEWKWYFPSVLFPRAVGEGHVVQLSQGLHPAAQGRTHVTQAVAQR